MVTEARPRVVKKEPPRVRLLSIIQNPFDLSIAAARTCYMPRVVDPSEITDKQRDSISQATFDGGHHTVYQHAHFVFGLENISRQLVWSLLHSHPFYNSEQSSQRFVRLDEVRAYVPDLEGQAQAVYSTAVHRAWDYYRRLTTILKRDAWEILAALRHFRETSSPGNDKRRRKLEREAEKKAIEAARYVIPVASFTSMVHTVSGISLHRLRRMQAASDTPDEAAKVVAAMVEAVQELDPNFFEKIGEPPLSSNDLPEFSDRDIDAETGSFTEEFDRKLEGRISKLVDFSPNGEEIVADAARAVLGAAGGELATETVLSRLLDPHLNPLRTDTLNVAVHSPLMRALNHTSYAFMKKISHAADSQDQRHRMVPGSRPMLSLADSERPDYTVPMSIHANRDALSIYREAMDEAWKSKNRLLEMGIPRARAIYLLPNAQAVRFTESGSLIHLLHKWTMRTCFNAQEEIYRASMEEIEQVRQVHPRIGAFLGPPCVIRNGVVSPRCTEGDRFCGVPVWQSFPHVERPI